MPVMNTVAEDTSLGQQPEVPVLYAMPPDYVEETDYSRPVYVE